MSRVLEHLHAFSPVYDEGGLGELYGLRGILGPKNEQRKYKKNGHRKYKKNRHSKYKKNGHSKYEKNGHSKYKKKEYSKYEKNKECGEVYKQ